MTLGHAWSPAIAAVFCFGAPLAAQQLNPGPLVLSQPGSTRALALGNAFVLGADDSDAIFYNAALADQLRGISAAYQTTPQPDEDGRLFTFSGATEWWGGAAAIGVQAISYGAPRDESVNGVPATGIVGAVAYARRILGIRFAATGKLIEQRFGEARSSTVAFDIATARTIGFVNVGLAASNMGPNLDFDSPYDGNLPERMTLSASTRARPAGPLDLLATGAITSDIDGNITGGVGVETAYWPISGRTFFARVGLLHDETDHITLGAGFTGDRIGLDYAYVDGGGHRAGIRWR